MISVATRTLSSLSRLNGPLLRAGLCPTPSPLRFDSCARVIHVSSTVYFSENRIHAGDDGNRVGHEAIAQHVRQALEVDERRTADVHPVRLGRPVAGDVAA